MMESKKKKPGRPKNPTNATAREFHGIVTSSNCPDNILEFVHTNPIMIKKIFALQKSFAVGEIEMIFSPTNIMFVSQDHLKKSKIFATIEGKYVSHYYCKELIRICVKLEVFVRIFGTLNKTTEKVSFILKQENYRSILYVILKDVTYDCEDTYEINILNKPDGAVTKVPNTEEYPIQFRIDSKYLKTKITNIQKLSKNIVMQKIHNEPFQMTYETNPASHMVNWTGTYGSAEKIDLKCSLGPNDILSVTVNIDAIKPFTHSTIGDEVTIAVHPASAMSFVTLLDKKEDGGATCAIAVFTDICLGEHIPGGI